MRRAQTARLWNREQLPAVICMILFGANGKNCSADGNLLTLGKSARRNAWPTSSTLLTCGVRLEISEIGWQTFRLRPTPQRKAILGG